MVAAGAGLNLRRSFRPFILAGKHRGKFQPLLIFRLTLPWLFRGFLSADACVPNTRAKILSTFLSWRDSSKAYSICLRGTLLVISLSG